MMERRDVTVDPTGAIEGRPLPRMRKIAPLGEHAAGAAQAVDRAAATGAAAEGRRARPPERALQALGRIAQRLLEPRAERARVQTVRLRLGQDGEQRIDARLDGTLAQQLGAESVNGVDVGFFERLERVLERSADGPIGRFRALALQFLAQPELQLTRRLLRES